MCLPLSVRYRAIDMTAIIIIIVIIIIIKGETDFITMPVLFLYLESSRSAASSNILSTGAAVGATVGVMAAVMTAGVAVGVIWMWRRQWILPCVSMVIVGECSIRSKLCDLKCC